MSTKVLLHNIDNHLKAINLCLDHHLRMPALVLIYSGIDIMSALSRPAGTDKAGKQHFILWAERHMCCQDRIGVSGIDLYAARCGIVHTATGDSSLSNDGHARKLLYTWGNRQTVEPMALLKSLGFTEIMVRIEDLADALCAGIASFGEEIDRDPNLASLVSQRSEKFYDDQATFP